MHMHSELVKVTPLMAQEWLSHNTRNRPLRMNVVNTYAEDMIHDRWQLNGETIKFSLDDEILDGQHRLHAIVKAKRPITLMIVRGLPRESFHTIDTGMRRTGGQIIGLDGVANANVVASICRWLVLLEKKTPYYGRHAVTTPELFDALQRYPLAHYFARRQTEKGVKELLPSPCGAVFVLASVKYGQDVADQFVSSFGPGAGLQKGDPVYELRERLIGNYKKTARLSVPIIVAMTVKAVRAYAMNKTVGLLRWSQNEDFPEL